MNILDQEQGRKEAGMLPQVGDLLLNRSNDTLNQLKEKTSEKESWVKIQACRCFLLLLCFAIITEKKSSQILICSEKISNSLIC
jgi:hypothetical protein